MTPRPTAPATGPAPASAPAPAIGGESALSPSPALPLLRIQEVAAEVGLTPRSIRYYEELGLLRPAARSAGAYRLYDASDLERLRFIRGLRDDAGFSLAEIGRLLEDQEARIRDSERFRASVDPAERRALVEASLQRVERQIATLEQKAGRLREMTTDAERRREHLLTHLRELESGRQADRGKR